MNEREGGRTREIDGERGCSREREREIERKKEREREREKGNSLESIKSAPIRDRFEAEMSGTSRLYAYGTRGACADSSS